MTHNVLKRTLAGVLAVACAAGFAPANSISPVNFADSSIIASAEEDGINFVRTYMPVIYMAKSFGDGCSKEEAAQWARDNFEEDDDTYAYYIYSVDMRHDEFAAVIVYYTGRVSYTVLSIDDVGDIDYDGIPVYWCMAGPKSISDDTVFEVGDKIDFGNGTYILDRWYDVFESRRFNGVWIVNSYEYWTDHYYIELLEPDGEGGGESTYIHFLMEDQGFMPTGFRLYGDDGETEATPLNIGLEFDIKDAPLSNADITMAGNSADVEYANYNGYDLTEGVDYTLTYKDSTGKDIAKPTAAGSYTAVFTGIGRFTGTVEIGFSILKTLSVGTYIEVGESFYLGDATYLWADDDHSYYVNNVQIGSGINSIKKIDYNERFGQYAFHLQNQLKQTDPNGVYYGEIYFTTEKLDEAPTGFYVVKGDGKTEDTAFEFALTYESVPDVTASAGITSVDLSWNEISDAEMYAVCGYANGKWQILAKTSDVSYTLKGLKAATQYKLAVIPMLGGQWKMDFSKAITVKTKSDVSPVYPIVTSTEYNEEFHQFRINWTPVPGAENYGIAVYLAGKWKVQTQSIPGSATSYTSPKLTPGKTYKLLVAAKVDGSWDLSAMTSRFITVTVK